MHSSVGKLYVVATPIGNLEDLSERARHVLSQVTWVAAEDTRHSAGLLHAIGATPLLLSYHEHNEDARIASLIERLQRGESGALISDAGTPLISDPGYGLVFAAHQAGIVIVPIPGPCSPIAALSASGLPTDKFFFEGFLPAKSAARIKRLTALKDFSHTLVFLEAPHRIVEFLQDVKAVLGESRRLCMARELTKKFESIILLPVAEMLAAFEAEKIPQKGEFVMVIEGAPAREQSETEAEMSRVLSVLLPEMPLKQAVMIAAKLTGLSKNQLYDVAVKLANG